RAGVTYPLESLARRAGLAVSAVRFYGDRGLLPPAAVDPRTGYRTYDAGQVGDAVLIRDLRRLGLPLARVTAYLAAEPAARWELLDDHVAWLARRLADARRVAHALHDVTTRTEPPMTQRPTPATTTVAARDLGGALDQVLPAASRDPERPVLTCVLVEARHGSLRLAATDSYRLAVRDVVPSGEAGPAFRSLVPAATLRRWRDDLPGDGDVTIGVRDDHLVVRGDAVDLHAWQVPAGFPDYEAVMVRDGDAHAVVVRRDDLRAALARFAGTDGAVLVRVAPGRLTVLRGDEEVVVAAEHDGRGVDVALDPAFATDAVVAAIGQDLVVEVADALRPVVFRSADDGTFTTMLMPVRLD
ncbi:MAG TPA: MerR family transcriptional regulator, partial [Acidimicrobiales bacterium]|nr:MerR family transcriptional regulator [Acidimicrobiales bacterium]